MMSWVMALNLDRAVLDSKAAMERRPGNLEQPVRIACQGSHDMGGERRLRRAQRPDVEVMNCLDALKTFQRILHLLHHAPIQLGLRLMNAGSIDQHNLRRWMAGVSAGLLP